MKKIEAIIKPFKLDEVSESLQDIGVGGMTVTEVRGFGNQKKNSEGFAEEDRLAELLPRIKIEMVVDDKFVDKVVATIQKAAHSGKSGDGKIFVSPVDEVIRIRNNDKGLSAL